ncbi:tyrosine-type recombinase/integrase [Salipiger bermudensis]|uniref:Phage integrase n=1 Tax=Salipiger bermudensis (strain DSM 26914 / JCM 13377 / KCTC 12554 / HTCC2601) TaxID=314265 RepID=Q0FT82_SALBH|nr:site-specific integrase [Salipiger bermudensis]EAU47287.1 Phage integrase [Salipiger bermudensis HTCC2601]
MPQTMTKTVTDACESWLKTCERNQLERSTLKAYRSHARVHIEPKIGDLLLGDLSRGQVRDFMHELLDDGISQALVRKVMVSLRAVLSEAVEREWIEHDVATDVKMRRRRRSESDERVIPTKDEIRLIVENAPASHRAMFIAAIFTGMRISELRGLTWDNVDLDRGLVHVRQRADEHCVLGKPKSRAGHRDIPMTPLVRDTLAQWQRTVPVTVQNLVFPNGAGKIQNYSNIYNRVFKPMLVANGIVDAAGEPKFGLHALRHAAASLFIEQGWNPKKIQTLLGHASITMTMDVYGHLFENAEEDVSMFAKLESDLLAA